MHLVLVFVRFKWSVLNSYLLSCWCLNASLDFCTFLKLVSSCSYSLLSALASAFIRQPQLFLEKVNNFQPFSATSQSSQAGPASWECNHCSHLWFCIQMGLSLVPCCNCLEIFNHKTFYAKYKTSKCIQKIFPFFLKHSASWFLIIHGFCKNQKRINLSSWGKEHYCLLIWPGQRFWTSINNNILVTYESWKKKIKYFM